MSKFRSLLCQTPYNRPNEYVMRKIESNFYNRLLALDTVDGARSLYEDVRNMPTTTVKADVRRSFGITVNGPLYESRTTILSGATSSGRPVVIKLDTSLSSVEFGVVERLQLHSHEAEPHPAFLMNCTALEMLKHITQDSTGRQEENICMAFVMPMYCCTLAALPQLENGAILKGLERMATAMDYIHRKNFVHMDVKSDNVFVDAEGLWTLGDFGSCVEINAEVFSTTRMFHLHVLIGKPAQKSFDYEMFAVMIAIEFNKTDWKQKFYKDKVVSTEAVLDECVRLRQSSTDGLERLLGTVLQETKWS